ncbi:MAG: hypothetical protein JNK18_00495 [Cyclobacteriaceae bacterium]|nr:hypothetical protein [Cyclobacteriaceae bacterium]
METLIAFLKYSHITAGVISLVSAPVAMAAAKGSRSHRLWGKIFLWCMVYIFVSAVILGTYHWKPFLLMVSVLSFYLVYSGTRTIHQKQIHLGKGVTWYDWTVAALCGVFMLAFLVWSIDLMVSGTNVVLILFFSVGGLFSVVTEMKRYQSRVESRHSWLFNHIGRMTGGFIAAVTAFSTNVLTFLPGIVQWLWPTLIGNLLIIFWIRTYRKKLDNGVRITDLVQLNRQ